VSEGWSGRRGSNPRPTAWKAVTLPLSYSRLRGSPLRLLAATAGKPAVFFLVLTTAALRLAFARSGHSTPSQTRPATSEPRSGESSGGEGRIRTFEATGATDLQSVAFDRFATSPKIHPTRRAGSLCPAGHRPLDVPCPEQRRPECCIACSFVRICRRSRFFAVQRFCVVFVVFGSAGIVELAKGFEPPTG
jgi:hypothetical protein